MMKRITLLAFLPLAGAWSDLARAHDAITARAPLTPVAATVSSIGGMGQTSQSHSVLVFGSTSGRRVSVAASSPRATERGPQLPVMGGPWMALWDGDERDAGLPHSRDRETSNKVRLAPDGSGQGLGAFFLIDALFGSERRTVSPSKPTIRIAPASLPAGAYGLLAIGTF